MRLNIKEIDKIIENALNEDVGKGDLTSLLVIPEKAGGKFVFVAREEMVVCGIVVLERIFAEVSTRTHVKDGQPVESGKELFTVSGNARAILKRERVALNLTQRMSGIATLTSKYVQAVRGAGVKILDTRKTTPGLRVLEKYAVRCGGGQNHRMRLDDGILIKDNHISICGGVSEAVKRARNGRNLGKTIEVECDTMRQAKEAIAAGAGMLLLDNMSVAQLKEIVKINAGKLLLEASGGVTLKNVRNVAATGVDYISVGALTHSARSVDIGLDEKDK